MTDIYTLNLTLTVEDVVVVMAVVAACMIIQVSAHGCGGNTNVCGIRISAVVVIRVKNMWSGWVGE